MTSPRSHLSNPKKMAWLKRFGTFSLISSFLLVASLSALPTLAATSPASKCITTATKATHTAAVAKMEKNIAPYLNNPNATKVIETYRQSIASAWDAMTEPYCGYGVYGVRPFIKSYSKSVNRANAAFATDIKKIGTAKATAPVTASTPVVAPTPVVKPTEKAPLATVRATATTPVVKSTLTIPPGLAPGMRSNSVLALQTFLTKRFKLAADAITTGYYGPLTRSYVLKFQLEQKVITGNTSPGAGLVGPKTAAAIRASSS